MQGSIFRIYAFAFKFGMAFAGLWWFFGIVWSEYDGTLESALYRCFALVMLGFMLGALIAAIAGWIKGLIHGTRH